MDDSTVSWQELESQIIYTYTSQEMGIDKESE